MNNIILNLEVRSPYPLEEAGVYPFVDTPGFHVLSITYSVDFGAIQTIDFLSGDTLPTEIANALTDTAVTKYAFNAQFVRVCLSSLLHLNRGQFLNPKGWICLKVWGLSLGLPNRLDKMLHALHLSCNDYADTQRFLRTSCNADWNATRCTLQQLHDPLQWQLLKRCRVKMLEDEMQLFNWLAAHPMSEQEWRVYWAHQKINDRGIKIDSAFVKSASICDSENRRENSHLFKDATGIDAFCAVPNQAQFRDWLINRGMEVDSLSKDAVRKMRRHASCEVDKALEAWQLLSRQAPQKYHHFLEAAGFDHRIRGLLDFNNGRCGVFGNTFLQIDNLPVCKLTALADIRQSVTDREFQRTRRMCESVPEALSQMLSTSFIPDFGHKIYVAEYRALNDRIQNWLISRNEMIRDWVPVFEGFRQKKYTHVDSHVNQLYWNMETAARMCLLNSCVIEMCGICFQAKDNMMMVQLPSGRNIVYQKPIIVVDADGFSAISYDRYDSKSHCIPTIMHGCELTRDIVNGIARDLMAHYILDLDREAQSVVLHYGNTILVEYSGMNSITITAVLHDRPGWAADLHVPCDVGMYNTYFERSLNSKMN